MQIICGLYLSAVEGWSIIFSVQSSHEFCVQDAYLLFRFSQKNVHLKLRWPSCSCNCRIEIQGPNWVMPASVHWKFSWSGSASMSYTLAMHGDGGSVYLENIYGYSQVNSGFWKSVHVQLLLLLNIIILVLLLWVHMYFRACMYLDNLGHMN